MKSLLLWVMILALLAIASLAIAAVAPPPAQPAPPKCCILYFMMTPYVIDYPAYTKPTVEKDTFVIIQSTVNTDLVFSSVVKYEDSCKGPGCESGWLSFSGAPTVIHPDSADTMIVKLNYGGVITNTIAPHRLWGRIVFEFNGDWSPYTLPISFVVADSIAGVKFDTIATATNIKLIVGSNGNMGHNYQGKVNMNFNPPVECDTGSNSRGNADIYLGDASPIIVRKVGSNPARMSSAIFNQGYVSPYGFKPLPHGQPPLHTNAAKWQQFFSGTFTTVDSLLKLEMTWFAPTNSVDTANFVIEKLQIWPTTAGAAVSNLAIGEAYDWDIPTDSGTSLNSGGFDSTKRLVYQYGFESADTISDCSNNRLRYGGSALIAQSGGTRGWWYCGSEFDSLYGGYIARNDSFVYPSMGFVPEQLWTNMQPPGMFNRAGVGNLADLHSVLVFKNALDTGWTFPAMAHDTLTIWTVMGVVRNAVSPTAGLDSLKKVIDKGKKWASIWIRGCWTCGCIGHTGNVNMTGITDSADLAALVSYLTGGGYVLTCVGAANVNNEGIVDSADLAALVSYLSGGGFVLPNCP